MAISFKDRIKAEYVLPMSVSIFGDSNVASIDDLIETALSDLDSDLEIYEHLQVNSINTVMPEGTKIISSVKLTFPFQGNRYVKHTYSATTRILSVRYFPCEVTYKRDMKLEDLDTLKGAMSKYIKAYVLEKMAAKELAYLTSIKLDTEEGDLNLSALEDFREKQEELYNEMQQDIVLYSNG